MSLNCLLKVKIISWEAGLCDLGARIQRIQIEANCWDFNLGGLMERSLLQKTLIVARTDRNKLL